MWCEVSLTMFPFTYYLSLPWKMHCQSARGKGTHMCLYPPAQVSTSLTTLHRPHLPSLHQLRFVLWALWRLVPSYLNQRESASADSSPSASCEALSSSHLASSFIQFFQALSFICGDRNHPVQKVSKIGQCAPRPHRPPKGSQDQALAITSTFEFHLPASAGS